MVGWLSLGVARLIGLDSCWLVYCRVVVVFYLIVLYMAAMHLLLVVVCVTISGLSLYVVDDLLFVFEGLRVV